MRATEELASMATREPRQPAAASAKAAQRISAPGLDDLATRLSDTFDTRVKVELGRRKGKIVVEFASVDDLQRIVGMIAPQVSPRGDGGSES